MGPLLWLSRTNRRITDFGEKMIEKQILRRTTVFLLFCYSAVTLANCTSEGQTNLEPPGLFSPAKVLPGDAAYFLAQCPELKEASDQDRTISLIYHRVYFSKGRCGGRVSDSCGAFVVNTTAGSCDGPIDLLDTSTPFQFEDSRHRPFSRRGITSELPVLFDSEKGEVLLFEWPFAFSVIPASQ